MLGLIYPTHLFVATLCVGPMGLVAATVWVVGVSSQIADYLLQNYVITGQMDKLFDVVLCNEGLELEVYSGRLRRITSKPMGKRVQEAALGTLPFGVVSFPVQLARFVRSNWWNAVPLAGPVFSFLDMAKAQSVGRHQRYFRLMRMKPVNVKYHVKDNEARYISFGVVAVLLETIPLLGPVFSFTNHTGAALMAVEMHKEKTKEKTKETPKETPKTES
ncbi:unnamed protein product [Kuraishia capsulata CBS 1993]|uniref:Outer spore wall protein RRT8 n=1 Tax=Kuraishia capsulata CBS 1993 TaxID=1382522 RepID=W6MFN1_9ASCO|nr:uncharacterized protein KUCA_T00000630001 [Kuraishia capsulata CBS 1993]CDK24664.1 unnamed protein product [Kuraishia capsulata CBS 1993]